MTLLDFYLGLPTIQSFPKQLLYVKGYTEALNTFQGVRVVPDYSFCEGISQLYLKYLKALPAPYYFIPIHRNNQCYGFVVKGLDKRTPSIKSNHLLPGCDLMTKGKPVVIVEGLKDCYLTRKAGILTVPMLTSSVNTILLQEFADLKIPVILSTDNDSHRENSIFYFINKFCEI